VSEFRIEKRRAPAQLTLATGATVRGSFFLAASSANGAGPERVADLLNGEQGFFPFEIPARGSAREHTVLFNRAQLVSVTLEDAEAAEAQHEPGYAVATERRVRMLLSDARTIDGSVRVYRPSGRDRLSDYARGGQLFRYIETAAATLIVNIDHIVELREIGD
jgi:hypothetical protein